MASKAERASKQLELELGGELATAVIDGGLVDRIVAREMACVPGRMGYELWLDQKLAGRLVKSGDRVTVEKVGADGWVRELREPWDGTVFVMELAGV